MAIGRVSRTKKSNGTATPVFVGSEILKPFLPNNFLMVQHEVKFRTLNNVVIDTSPDAS